MKKNLAMFSAILIISVFAISIVSAGWWSSTGNAVRGLLSKNGESTDVNVSVENVTVNGIIIGTISCKESDGGLNYYQAGKTCLGDKCKKDTCLDKNVLLEYYIKEEAILKPGICSLYADIFSEKYKCPNGCSNGACIKGTEQVIFFDHAHEIVVEGKTSYFYVGGAQYTIKVLYLDKDYAILSVNGESTNKLKLGQTQKLSSGRVIKVDKIIYSSYNSTLGGVNVLLG